MTVQYSLAIEYGVNLRVYFTGNIKITQNLILQRKLMQYELVLLIHVKQFFWMEYLFFSFLNYIAEHLGKLLLLIR